MWESQLKITSTLVLRLLIIFRRLLYRLTFYCLHPKHKVGTWCLVYLYFDQGTTNAGNMVLLCQQVFSMALCVPPSFLLIKSFWGPPETNKTFLFFSNPGWYPLVKLSHVKPKRGFKSLSSLA